MGNAVIVVSVVYEPTDRAGNPTRSPRPCPLRNCIHSWLPFYVGPLTFITYPGGADIRQPIQRQQRHSLVEMATYS